MEQANEELISGETKSDGENAAPTEKSLEKNKKGFSVTNIAQLTTHGFNNVISVFVQTFLVSYIYSISENYMLNIGLFYVFNYFTMALFYLIVSSVIDKTNRVLFYRIALFIKGSFILLVIFTGQKLANLVMLAGALHGFADACYYVSFNIMKNELVRKSQAKKFSGIQTGIEKMVQFVFPIVLGTIIDVQSFKISAIMVASVILLQIIASFFIKSKRPENSSFDLFGFFKEVKGMGEKKKLVTGGIMCGAFYGLFSCISSANTILIMLVYNSNFSLGILTGIFSLMSVVFLIVISKFSKPGKRGVMYILGGLLPLIAAILVSINVNKVFIIIFSIIFTIFQITFAYPYDIFRNVVMKKLQMYDSIAEFQACIEVSMEMARVFSYGIMAIVGVIGLSFGTDGLIIAARIFVPLSSASLVLINLCMMFYEKRLVKEGIL